MSLNSTQSVRYLVASRFDYPPQNCTFYETFNKNTREKLTEIGKVISATGLRSPYVCEISRLPRFLYNRFTDGIEVVSLKHRPRFNPQEVPWYRFLLKAESNQRS
jgi:hypothetical protein